jgi:broad specificity phosphatase PhoE
MRMVVRDVVPRHPMAQARIATLEVGIALRGDLSAKGIAQAQSAAAAAAERWAELAVTLSDLEASL